MLTLLACTGVAVAEDAQTPAGAYKHWLTDLPPPLAGVETQHWFPDHPGQRFIAGALVSFWHAVFAHPPTKAPTVTCRWM